jgi:hypothetical protein
VIPQKAGDVNFMPPQSPGLKKFTLGLQLEKTSEIMGTLSTSESWPVAA